MNTILREMGYHVVNFAEHQYQDDDILIYNYNEQYKHPSPQAIVYQLSTGSPVTKYLLTRSETLFLNYHNITPGEIFAPWEPAIANTLFQARQELPSLVKHAKGAIADSKYNATELKQLGMRNVIISPPIFDFPDSTALKQFSRRKDPELLTIGRIAPNKGLENIISTLPLLHKFWPNTKLIIIGVTVSHKYEQALRELTRCLNLTNFVSFLGPVPNDIRDRYYARASLYISASRHEGFCIPVLEAMSMGLPVVARNGTAISETIKNTGLLIDSGEPIHFAATAHRILSETRLWKYLTEAGKQRSKEFSIFNSTKNMKQAIEKLFHEHRISKY